MSSESQTPFLSYCQHSEQGVRQCLQESQTLFYLEPGCPSIPCKVKDLGVVLDSGVTKCDHINPVCCSAYLELRRIGSILPFLAVEAAVELTRSRILSRIDNCTF